MSDADDRFVEALAAELDLRLGPRIHLVDAHLERLNEGRLRITVHVDTSYGAQRMVEEGDSLTSVAARLIERAPIHRLADGFREVVEPATIRRRT